MAQLIDFYLLDENKKHWAEIQRLTKENTPEADEILGKYALEGTRLSTSLGVLRRVVPDGGRETVEIEQAGQKITAKKGDMIFVSFVSILLLLVHHTNTDTSGHPRLLPLGIPQRSRIRTNPPPPPPLYYTGYP